MRLRKNDPKMEIHLFQQLDFQKIDPQVHKTIGTESWKKKWLVTTSTLLSAVPSSTLRIVPEQDQDCSALFRNGATDLSPPPFWNGCSGTVVSQKKTHPPQTAPYLHTCGPIDLKYAIHVSCRILRATWVAEGCWTLLRHRCKLLGGWLVGFIFIVFEPMWLQPWLERPPCIGRKRLWSWWGVQAQDCSQTHLRLNQNSDGMCKQAHGRLHRNSPLRNSPLVMQCPWHGGEAKVTHGESMGRCKTTGKLCTSP